MNLGVMAAEIRALDFAIFAIGAASLALGLVIMFRRTRFYEIRQANLSRKGKASEVFPNSPLQLGWFGGAIAILGIVALGAGLLSLLLTSFITRH